MEVANNPNSKYGQFPEAASSEQLLFFNYHEFLVNNYCDVRSEVPVQHKQALVVSHFPNNYVPTESASYRQTRIVRIPRDYATKELSYMIPQFSSYLPGTEPASLKQAEDGFTVVGKYDYSVFGSSSCPPLIPNHLSELEYKQIVGDINGYLLEAFSPYNWRVAVENFLDVATGTLYSKVFNRLIVGNTSQTKLEQLETFVEEEINQKMLKCRDIRVISPRRSGYLSVCIRDRY